MQWDATVTRPLAQVLRLLRPNHPDYRRALGQLNDIVLAIDASQELHDPGTRERAAITLESVLAVRQAVERRTGVVDRDDPELMIRAAHDSATSVVMYARAGGASWTGREAWDNEVRIPLEDARRHVRQRDVEGGGTVDLGWAGEKVNQALTAALRLVGTTPRGDARSAAAQTWRAILGAQAAIAGAGGGHVGHDAIVVLAGIAHDEAVRMGSRESLEAARALNGAAAPPAPAAPRAP
jgi:hypothetical protein